jgi:hypothetical protein
MRFRATRLLVLPAVVLVVIAFVLIWRVRSCEAYGPAIALLDVPERCLGGLIALDADGDGRLEIVRDGCPTPGRVSVGWDGRAFVHAP